MYWVRNKYFILYFKLDFFWLNLRKVKGIEVLNVVLEFNGDREGERCFECEVGLIM